MKFNNRDVAIKLIAALHVQGMVNDLTYLRIMRKYAVRGGVHVGQRQSA